MSLAAGRPASRVTALRLFGQRPERRDPALAVIEGTLQPGERIQATAYCCAGIGGLSAAGLAGMTDRRIVFVPRKGPPRSYPYTQVRAVHEEAGVGPQRRIRVALADAGPLHLVAGIMRMGVDPYEIIRRHCL